MDNDYDTNAKFLHFAVLVKGVLVFPVCFNVQAGRMWCSSYGLDRLSICCGSTCFGASEDKALKQLQTILLW